MVLYPAIYVHGRKRPWDFIDAVTAVEDARFARCMAEMYEEDLENSTEIVLGRRNRVIRSIPRARGAASAARAPASARPGTSTNRRLFPPAPSPP